jgi:hypothetical protein
MCCFLEARGVNEIPVDSMQWFPSFLGLGWYASVLQGVVLLREARSAHGLRKIEPWLVEGDNELPTVVFDGSELAQELN